MRLKRVPDRVESPRRFGRDFSVVHVHGSILIRTTVQKKECNNMDAAEATVERVIDEVGVSEDPAREKSLIVSVSELLSNTTR